MFEGINYVIKEIKVTPVVLAQLKAEMIRKYMDGYDGKFKLVDVAKGFEWVVYSIQSCLDLPWDDQLNLEIISEPIVIQDKIVIFYKEVYD